MTRSSSGKRLPYRQLIGWMLAGLLLLLILLGGFKGYRIYIHARSAWDTARDLIPLARQVTASPRDVTVYQSILQDLSTLEADAVALREELSPFFPVMRRMGWVPRVGGLVSVSPDLLEAGIALLTGGRISLENALPLLEAFAEAQAPSEDTLEIDLMARILPSLEASASSWRDVGEELDRANAILQGIDLSQLPPQLAHRIWKLRTLLPRARPLVDLIPSLPELLGAREERAYLIIAQNSDELRATGGFISGVGLVRLDRGKLTELTFRDSYAVDNLSQPHPPAPDALRRHMGAELLFLRDANWSPDFPTSAQVIQTLYRLDQGVETQGVIAFDLIAVRMLVDALEPLDVPGVEAPLTGENVLAQIKAAWARPAEGVTIEQDAREWWRRRKDFMPALVQAAVRRLFAGDVDFVRLGRAVWQAANEKHILIYLDDPSAQEAIVALGWDGGLRPGGHDYLAVFDTNVGYNKVNAVVTREMDYTVAWEDDAWMGRLVLTYTHPIQIDLEACIHRPKYGRTYEDMTRRCYWDYVRVYVPEGSRLIRAEGLDPVTVQEMPGEEGSWVVAGLFVMRPGTTRVVQLTYRLPDRVAKDGIYRLRVQKQPGIVEVRLRLSFIGPPGTIWRTADGQRGDRFRREAALRRDITWEVYRLASPE